MKTKSLLGCDAQLARWSAISALPAVGAALKRRRFARAVEGIAGEIVIRRSAAAGFESIRWSEAG